MIGARGCMANDLIACVVLPALVALLLAAKPGACTYRYNYEDYDTMMGTCRENEVCNIVHHRHWMPSTVDKVCRCPLNTPSCPVVHTRHGNVMNVNSRTQMKFCAPLRNLRPCRDGEIALRRKTLYQSYGVKNVSIVVDCLCDHRQSYWTFHNRSGEDFNDAHHLFTVVQNYKCVAMKRCAPHEFCGYGRRDYGFIYHRCTCPVSHQCKFDLDEYDDDVSELFYQGPAYLARCVPIYDYDWW
ncbi:uncharacterized protein LOC120901696 [Anopheles arabiensis]|uniref:Uncharacterized protein n=3 Tax=gambiae species complex TaxID=44542 RepID=A0A6E8VSQ3_ANOCL|nr:uncharacterized protein LOC120901696 [Anopheles arabiensis]XP_040222832.2 uncharacterized protein LOC120949535 [Anopheles coluzzii]XP_565182.3 uncharacterized protein LOC3290290 [Anopheles gambiae]